MQRTFVGLAACVALGQQPPDPVFTATTKLVQVSVIAQDKDGKPVADLRREEFQVFDNGSAQEIRLFESEAEKSSAPAPPAPKAAGMFTNQIAAPEGSHSGYAVILIDTLETILANETQGGSGAIWAKEKAIQMLGTLPPDDTVAIYALGYKVWVIREFTRDHESLARQLRTWKPTQDIIPEQNKPAVLRSEVEQIAEHLAGIPGRKNLIWIAERYPIAPPAVQKLKTANVAVYPVDADGSTIGLPGEKSARSAPLRALAAMTGGVAYFDRDDLDVAIREAIEDGRVSYTLGFYQPGEETKASIHQIGVRVSRPGVTLRYRSSYETEPPHPVSAKRATDVQALMQAMNRPVDATAIAITASATRTLDRLDLLATVDLPSLDLNPSQGMWRGKAELVARFVAADGTKAGEVISQTLTFNLRQATYESMRQHGVSYHKELKIPPKAVELKLLIANLATGKIGTLTIPLADIKEVLASAR